MKKPELLQMPILIVDDNVANTNLLSFMLEDEGYENIISLNDSRDVRSTLEKESVDLMILDIRMPHIDGFEIIDIVQNEFDHLKLPIIVVTAEDSNRERALHLGAVDFVTKPFVNWEVMLRITNTLQNRFYYNRELSRSAELEELVKHRTKEIEETQLEIVRRLAIAGEYRDNETGMHVLRMSHMCSHIAKTIGCDDEFNELILRASPLHDVGKIGISDTILLKEGPLTPEERLIMEGHVNIGYEILSGHHSKLLNMAVEIAFYHHEKWDGTGYPSKLKGKSIPLSARIAALCDVVDALLSKRPYKEPWPLSRVVDLLKEESGAHFEPGLVNVFLQELDQIEVIRSNFSD